MQKSVLDKAVSFIQIDANACFEIKLNTKKTDEVYVEAQIEGEYSKDLELNLKEEGNTLLVSAGFRPSFKNPNDKLSAHKVVSITLNIILPQGKNVKLYGTSTRVTVKGSYDNLNISLSDGTCELINVSKDVEVRTQSGDILLSTPSGIINAESKYGFVDDNPIPKGNIYYNLNTVTGNILFSKIE